jgi:hypothetical protein
MKSEAAGERNTALPDDDRAAAVARALAFDLPAACVPGVAQNSALLHRHWAALRAPRSPE